MDLDRNWFLDLNHIQVDTSWPHGFLAAYALWGGLVLLALLLVGTWLLVRHRPDAPRAVAIAVLTGVGSVVALLLNQQVFSPTIARPRPCTALAHVHVLLTCKPDYSMPSDHCIIAGALAAGLLVLDRRIGAIAVLLSLLLAFGRVYVGVHYPSDAVVGLLIGAAITTILVLALRQPATALARRLAATPLRPLIVARGAARQA